MRDTKSPERARSPRGEAAPQSRGDAKPSSDPRGAGASSAAKALAVLEYIGINGRASLADIARHTGLPKSTELRLISTLVKLGYLKRTQHGTYAVTVKLWRIGCGAIDYEGVREDVVPTLRALSAETSETALYATYEDGYSVYIEKIEGPHPIRAYAVVGSRAPAYACATGKAQLAWRGAEEIGRLADAAVAFTKDTCIEAAALRQEAAEARARGYAVNRGEWHGGVWGVAAPIFDRLGNVVAAIGISGPRERFDGNIVELSRPVCRAATEISQRNGALAIGIPEGDILSRR